jgi:hypothetical protein
LGPWNRPYIIDARITDLDAELNHSRYPIKVLAAHKREKTKKSLEPCLEQHHHFTPFAISTDGMIGKESKSSSRNCPPY